MQLFFIFAFMEDNDTTIRFYAVPLVVVIAIYKIIFLVKSYLIIFGNNATTIIWQNILYFATSYNISFYPISDSYFQAQSLTKHF